MVVRYRDWMKIIGPDRTVDNCIIAQGIQVERVSRKNVCVVQQEISWFLVHCNINMIKICTREGIILFHAAVLLIWKRITCSTLAGKSNNLCSKFVSKMYGFSYILGEDEIVYFFTLQHNMSNQIISSNVI